MKYVFDTSTYSELLKGHHKVAEITRKSEQIFLPNIVIAELQYGFELGTRKGENEKLLAKFLANKKIYVLLPDNATTAYFVNIAVLARRKGVQLSTHDIWIAALSEQWDATLVSFDTDFKHLDYDSLHLLHLEKVT